MILINLLPHREAARKRRKELFFALLGASAVLGGVISGLVYVYFQTEIATQQSKNMILQQEIARFDKQIKEIATLQAEIDALKARQQSVENLQSDRNLPVHLLMDMVKQMPDGIYITNLKQDKNSIELKGSAQSQDRVSELLRNFGTKSEWFSRADLTEIVAGSVSLSARDKRTVSNFIVRLEVAPAGVSAAQAAASAAASGPVQAQKK